MLCVLFQQVKNDYVHAVAIVYTRLKAATQFSSVDKT